MLPLLLIIVLVQAGCATARHPISSPAATSNASQTVVPTRPSTARPRVGVAFGGGSARGLAHIGVIRWLEEHRVPIDLVAGTSMGGLIGGSFATGLDAEPLTTLLTTLDWDALFGSSNFAYRNIRRKADARAFPSHLEFGLKRGLGAPTALNNGQQVELLLTRISAPYHLIDRFDELPDALQRRRCGSRARQSGRARSWIARAGDAGDDVSSAHLSAGGNTMAGCSSMAAR